MSGWVSTARANTEPSLPIIIGVIALGLAATLAIEAMIGSPASLTQLEFGYGDKIARIMAGAGLGDATRLPAIPYALGLFGRVLDAPFAATLAKNLVLLALLGWVLARVWIDGPHDLIVAAGMLFLLSFPQLVRHTLALVPEEGWLIPLIAFTFHAYLTTSRETPFARLAPAMAAAASLVLFKSTMLLAGPALAMLLALRSGRRAIAGLALGLVAAALLGLSLLHLANAGRFTPASSLSGYDFWKGNNPAALAYFPERSLDAIGHLAPTWTNDLDEWAWSRRCVEEGLAFWREHPTDAIALTRRKFEQVFWRVTGEVSASSYPGRDMLKRIGIVWMVGFRVALWLAIVIAGATMLRALRNRPSSRDARLDALGFLLLIVTLSAPLLIAWGTERRLMPMVIPVFLYLWSVWRRQRAGDDRAASRRA